MKKRIILAAFAALFIIVGGLVFWGQHRQRTQALYYSGTIEGTEANLSFQVSGRVRTVAVDEGQAVSAGQVIAALDQNDFIARHLQARAEYNRAQAALKRAENVLENARLSLPAEVERAEAAERAARSQLAELESGFRSQDVERARLAEEEARATLDDAKRGKERFDRLFANRIVSEKDRDTAELRYQTALKEFGRAREAHALLQEGSRREAIEAARHRLAEARAAVKGSRGNLNQIAATAKEVEAARQSAQAAAATLELAEIQLSRTELKAPFDGTLVSRNTEPGEYATPGREVMTVMDLSRVDLKIFVDETEIGKVKPGQSAEIKTDTFPDKIYSGTVAYISPRAEFTPKIIQTHKERVKLVYLVKISIPNPDLELKPGMPADAWLR